MTKPELWALGERLSPTLPVLAELLPQCCRLAISKRHWEVHGDTEEDRVGRDGMALSDGGGGS